MENDLTRRALAAYFRTSEKAGTVPDQPSAASSGVVEHQGRTYVVLANNYRTLAVYRYRTTGLLRRLKRWPKAIEAMPPEPQQGPAQGSSGPTEGEE